MQGSRTLLVTGGATLVPEEQLVQRGLTRKARSNCILASSRLAALGIALRPIDVALNDAMKKYAAVLRAEKSAH